MQGAFDWTAAFATTRHLVCGVLAGRSKTNKTRFYFLYDDTLCHFGPLTYRPMTAQLHGEDCYYMTLGFLAGYQDLGMCLQSLMYYQDYRINRLFEISVPMDWPCQCPSYLAVSQNLLAMQGIGLV